MVTKPETAQQIVVPNTGRRRLALNMGWRVATSAPRSLTGALIWVSALLFGLALARCGPRDAPTVAEFEVPYNPQSGAAAPIGKVLALRAVNGKFVTVSANDEMLRATGDSSDAESSHFKVLDAGNGEIALRSISNGLIVSARKAGGKPLKAVASAVKDWERFVWRGNGESVGLLARVNQRYVSSDHTKPLSASRTKMRSWENFRWSIVEPDPHGGGELPVDCREYQSATGRTLQLRASRGDDTKRIRAALNGLQPGDTLVLTGDFHFTGTIYIPNGVSWILRGTMTLKDPANPTRNLSADLDMVGYKKWNSRGERVFDNNRRTGIAVKGDAESSQRARICMVGGSYYGEADTHIDWEYFKRTGKRPKDRIRLLNFIWVKDSLFLDMSVEDASDDCFTLGSQSRRNRVVRVTGRHAGGQSHLDNNIKAKVMGGNGLSDYGDGNKWYDCIAEYNGSDGFTPKCKNSEFHRCVARYNNGPGYGAYARLDGTLLDFTLGTAIDNNKFVDIVAHNNKSAGISMNVSSNCRPKGTVRGNYVSGLFFENGKQGVDFRNKTPDGIVDDNRVDVVVYNNGAAGVGTDAKPGEGWFVSRLKGTVVALDNAGEDLDLRHGRNSNIVIYHPRGKTVSAEIGKAGYNNTVTVKEFSCRKPPSAPVCKAYCEY